MITTPPRLTSRLPSLAAAPRSGALAAILLLAAPLGCVVHTGTAVTATVIEEPVTMTEPVATVVVDEPVAGFDASLAPHGAWVRTRVCGRAWRPHAHIVGAGFVPYKTGGHWVYTSQGWVFETDWEWGWAAFHYGRWCPDPHAGWVWLPDTEWAPAWVEWRTGGGYIGWAPVLPPAMVIVETHWVFVESRHFHHRHTVDHAIPPQHAHHAYAHTQPVREMVAHGSVSWSAGPRPADVARDTKRKVVPVPLVAPQPGTIRKTTVHTGKLPAPVKRREQPAPRRPAPTPKLPRKPMLPSKPAPTTPPPVKRLPPLAEGPVPS